MTALRLAIVLAFSGVVGTAHAVAQTPDGAALYRQNCKLCHGAVGTPSAQTKSTYKKIPTLADPAFQAGRSDDSMVAVITSGVGKDMKPFRGKLSREEMVAIVKFVRGFVPAKTP